MVSATVRVNETFSIHKRADRLTIKMQGKKKFDVRNSIDGYWIQ